MKRIIVTLAADGSISAESTGVPGPACIDDVSLIESLVPHSTIVDSRLTPEYFISERLSEEESAIHQEQDRA